MPNVVVDTSTLVGALLRENSVPARALLLARTRDTLCLSDAVEAEIRVVLARPKFARYATPSRIARFVALLTTEARRFQPIERVTDCRDAKDNMFLELALVSGAKAIVSSDEDLLSLDPWRGIRILSPADYVAAMSTV
jgi:putative PIN family toxin of toxin-antitoxin system